MKLLRSKHECYSFSSQQRIGRTFAVGSVIVGLLLCRAIDPTAGGAWLPLRMSCGAITGLPCIFCGLTRALHLLLNGNFAGALYFNWLAFPFLAGVIMLASLWMVELATNRTWLDLPLIARVNPKRIALVLGTSIALWILQAYLAVSYHKHELLNPRGPLYGLFVK
jgi:Protein of unknown function (DUF2752).